MLILAHKTHTQDSRVYNRLITCLLNIINEFKGIIIKFHHQKGFQILNVIGMFIVWVFAYNLYVINNK